MQGSFNCKSLMTAFLHCNLSKIQANNSCSLFYPFTMVLIKDHYLKFIHYITCMVHHHIMSPNVHYPEHVSSLGSTLNIYILALNQDLKHVQDNVHLGTTSCLIAHACIYMHVQ